MSIAANTIHGSLLSKRKKKIVPPPPTGAPQIDRRDYVTLISQDGHNFILERRCACVSKLIRAYIGGASGDPGQHSDSAAPAVGATQDVQWDAAAPSVIRFPFVSADLLEKAVQYFHYKTKYEHDPDQRTEFHVDPKLALDLIKIATLLQC